tara:strand:- start:275 stop:505 length:231 start_codon:yes stop_codon:yes gene_type:complete
MAKKRNYRREYDTYHKRTRQKKRRAGRNKARRMMIKKKGKSKLKGKDVHHKNGNARDNRKSNLAIMSKSKNRSRKV